VFATEIKALFGYPDVPRSLSELQIGRLLLRDHAPAGGATPFEGIYGLTGATIMSVDLDGAVEDWRYWQLDSDPIHEGRDEAYYVEAYRRILAEAVACRIRRAMQPPGLLFSGGYDSAAIAGLAGPVVAQSNRKLIAAASVMPADYWGTIRHARSWVEFCARDMPHIAVRYVTRAGKDLLTGLNETFARSELPVGSYDFVNRELLSTLAAAGAQVVMDGHGGDYTLNPRGDAMLARLLAMFEIRRFVSELRAYLRLSDHSLPKTLRHDVAGVLMPSWARRLWRRLKRDAAPFWRNQPINDGFGERLVADHAIGRDRLPADMGSRIDMRGRIARTLAQVMGGPAPGLAVTAATLGLELTRPFHDKRVVELALAVPQDLYVKNGRNRYLACMALRDIYPRELQTRGRKNDDQIPDFLHMVKSVEPQLLAEISEMEKSEKLGCYVDFKKIRLLLAARGPDQHNSGWEQETQLAAHGFTVARYLSWFWQTNR
jgi:asparagine synthase (glutamine-hydrolysing)